jgi:protein KRI1
VEILMATDTELNQYLSVKKYAPYRKENNWDKGRVDRLKDLKQTVAERSRGMGMSGGGSYQDVNGERAKKRKGKKERLKMKAAADGGVEGGDNVRVEVEDGDKLNGKRKHEKVEETETAQEGTTSGGKKRRRHKKMEQM